MSDELQLVVAKRGTETCSTSACELAHLPVKFSESQLNMPSATG